MIKNRVYTVSLSVLLLLFAVFVVLWIYSFQRYFVLNYHEQAQLFQFNEQYFYTYLSNPGGIADYLGSFLTQFYLYPVAGSLIIAGSLALLIMLFYAVCKVHGNIGWLQAFLFVPGILLFMSFLNIYFNISYAVGLLIALSGFRLYMTCRTPVRQIVCIGLYSAVYFVSAGNAFLFLLLIVIFELFEKKYKFKYLYLLLAIAWSAILPWLSWRFIYYLPVKDAYFSLTFLKMFFPTWHHQALWISIPALYLLWRYLAPKTRKWNLAPWKMILPNSLIVAALIYFCTNSVYDRSAEILYRMEHEVQHNNWKETIRLANAYPGRNRLVCFYVNIALAKTGQLPYRMFQYKQVGEGGLFFDNEMTYFSMGEVYYQLGLIAEAEHSAFEALVISRKEPNVRTLRRLVYTNIARRDSATAVKYLRYFDRSPTYRAWAKQQHAHLAKAMADASFHIPGEPFITCFDDFFVDHNFPDKVLLKLLKCNPQNRIVFEYLMAYYMLQKDIEKIKWCIDAYYPNFNYPAIPAHYEEALLVYQSAMKAGDDLLKQYPVSSDTRQRFARYNQMYLSAQGNKRNFELLEKQFGATYWFYLHYVKPLSLQKNEEKNRY